MTHRNRWFTGLPINSMVIFHGKLLVSHNQMVNIIHNNRHSPDDSHSAGVTGALPGFAMPKKSPKLWDLAAQGIRIIGT